MRSSGEDELSHLAHAFGSPLTAIQGAARMLALLRQEASPDERRLLEIIERNCQRLSGEVERLLAAVRVEENALQILLPLGGRTGGPAAESQPGEGGAFPEEKPAGRPLILVVDDDPAVREMLAHTLEQAGYVVLTASDGISAVDLARQYRPALITLDLAMPGIDGQRLLPVFKEDPAIKEIPVLVISALAAGGHLSIPGAVGALSKPVHREVLLRAVGDILHPPAEVTACRGKILLVDDEEDARRPLAADLNERGYAVFELGEGSATLEAVRYWEPDLVLLDLRLPDADGMEILRALKEDWRTSQTAVILLSAEQRPEEKARAFQLLADDYVTKPYSLVELVARIEAVLRRREMEFSTSPSTRLPGNVAIERALRQRLASGEPLAVCYADLDNFKAYNDVYGFLKGDGVIHQTARVLVEAVRELGNPDDFVGHVGGDDFVMLTTPDRAEPICRRVVEEFERVIPLYYDAEARERGYIETLDRQGRPTRFPLMSITLVIVTNEQRSLQHPGQVADIAAELKRKAKTIPGSVVFRDRRADPNASNARFPGKR